MSQSLCIRCLRRGHTPSTPSNPTNASSRAAFSTTPIHGASAPSKKSSGVVHKKGRQLTLRRNVRAVGKHPGFGERRAFKKRVVLSNTNALEVKGLKEFDLREGALTAGEVRAFSDETVDALRALEAFQPRQGWSLFRRPATVVRRLTVDLMGHMERVEREGVVVEESVNAEESISADESINSVEARDVAKKPDHSTAERRKPEPTSMSQADKPFSIVLDGERGSGKSVVLLQALALAHLRGWIVIHFPDAKDLVNAHTSYAPITMTRETTGQDYKRYIQPAYTAKLLDRIVKANGKVLSRLQLSKEHQLPIPIQANISLDRFAMLGAEDSELAWPIFRALWEELTTTPSDSSKPGLERPPVMLGLDGLSHIMGESAYLDVNAEPIHAHELTLVETFVSALRMPKTFINGGLTIGALSASDRPYSHTFEWRLAHMDGQGWDQYVPQDVQVFRALRNARIRKVEGITKEEAKALMEYWARSGLLRGAVTDSLVHDKWSLSGGGIIGEMERAVVRAPYFGV